MLCQRSGRVTAVPLWNLEFHLEAATQASTPGHQLPLGLHKITPTVAFPWLDKFIFSELEGTSIQQRHPFLHLPSLLAALVPLDFPSDTDGGGGQQCLLSLGSDPMRLIFMLLSMFQT